MRFVADIRQDIFMITLTKYVKLIFILKDDMKNQ